MRAFFLFFCFVPCTLLCAQELSSQELSPQDFAALDAATGQALFERNWVAAPSSTAAADGLGPYYTARSCAACHPDGGSSSEISALNFVVDDPVYGHLLQLRAVTGLLPEARVELSYSSVETLALADGTRVVLSKPHVTISALLHGAMTKTVSVRRAPALAGLALLEQVPAAQLQVLADADDSNGDGISGRSTAGRFGWKASVASLREQTARALSVDLGLGNSIFLAAAGDCTPIQTECQQAARALTGAELEVPDLVLDLLLSYLQNLSPPVTTTLQEEPGASHFTQLGCPACHTPQLLIAGGSLQPYTDLLIHDMGAGLADAADSPSATAAEWRTAPLWGLGRNTRFLHDGRAATLEEAILWHDGEAKASAAAYRHLNQAESEHLREWLLRL